MPIGTRAEFAAHRNVNKSTVTRWARAGKIVWTEDGQIDFEASVALIATTADPAKHGVSLRHARGREDRMVSEAMQATSPTDTPQPASSTPEAPASTFLPAGASSGQSSDYEAFNKARAEKEAELAKLARIKREEQESALVRRADVQRDIERLAVIVSKGLTSIPARVMPLLNAEADPGKREALLEEQIRMVLNEFADAALELSNG